MTSLEELALQLETLQADFRHIRDKFVPRSELTSYLTIQVFEARLQAVVKEFTNVIDSTVSRTVKQTTENPEFRKMMGAIFTEEQDRLAAERKVNEAKADEARWKKFQRVGIGIAFLTGLAPYLRAILQAILEGRIH